MAEKIFDDLNEWFEKEDMPSGKRKVLQAAITLFSQKGFDGTSTAEISELSGMSQGTIFKYFKTKRDLLNAIVQPAIENLIPNYASNFIDDQLPKNVTLTEFVNIAIKNRLEFVFTNKNIISIFINEIMINDELLNSAREKLTPVFDRVQETLESLFTQFNITILPEAFIRLIAGQILFEFLKFSRIIPHSSFDINHTAKSISKTVLKAIQ